MRTEQFDGASSQVAAGGVSGRRPTISL